MNKLVDYINEAMVELYHFTNAYNFINIIKDDEWMASCEGNEYFISTTRTKNATIGYPTQLIDKDNVIRIVFDGRRLNNNFKIKPVDKMRGKMWAIKSTWKNPEDFELYKKEILTQGNTESEDRVYVNRESIPNAHLYIKEVHINLDNIERKYINDIRNYCRRYGIELVEYSNTREFNRGN